MWRSIFGFAIVLSLTSSAWSQSLDQLLESAVTVAPQSASAATLPPLARSADELREAVSKLLATKDNTASVDAASVSELVKLHRELKNDAAMPAHERVHWQRRVTDRLTAMRQELQRRLPSGRQNILAQVPGNIFQPGQTGGGTATDPAEELIDIIQETIAPATWDIRGGQGVIRFWGPGSALIIRQSGDAHQALAQLIDDLR